MSVWYWGWVRVEWGEAKLIHSWVARKRERERERERKKRDRLIDWLTPFIYFELHNRQPYKLLGICFDKTKREIWLHCLLCVVVCVVCGDCSLSRLRDIYWFRVTMPGGNTCPGSSSETFILCLAFLSGPTPEKAKFWHVWSIAHQSRGWNLSFLRAILYKN